MRLPIGIKPTTAIPTYVLDDGEEGTKVLGYSSQGSVVDLQEADPDIHHKLSHGFIGSFGFNLRDIMPFMFLTTKISYKEVSCKHLCFVDTPGYNPSDAAGSHTGQDIHAAEEFAEKADALLWLIGLDANGTIGNSDLQFLEDVMQDGDKPLYIVLNKADLKPEDDLHDIMDEVAEKLDDYGIKAAGICAYSSHRKEEIANNGLSLAEFLEEQDRPSEKQRALMEKLHDVDLQYQRAILRENNENKQLSDMLKSIQLDLLQENLDDTDASFHTKLAKLDRLFKLRQNKDQLAHLEKVVEKLTAAINRVFGGKISSIQRHVLKPADISPDTDFAELMRDDEIPPELDEGQQEVAKESKPEKNEWPEVEEEAKEQRESDTEVKGKFNGLFESLFKLNGF